MKMMKTSGALSWADQNNHFNEVLSPSMMTVTNKIDDQGASLFQKTFEKTAKFGAQVIP